MDQNPLRTRRSDRVNRPSLRTLISLLACLLAGAGSDARAVPDGVTDVSSGAGGVGFVLSLADAGAEAKLATYENEPPAIVIDGLPSSLGEAGWQMPSRTVWVGVPPGAVVEGSGEPLDRHPLDLGASKGLVVPAARIPSASIAVGRPQWIRNQWAVPVTWNPVVGGSAGLFEERSVRVRIRFTGGSSPGALAGPDAWEDIYASLLVNYEQARSWRRAPAAPLRAVQVGDNFWTTTNPWLRITVTHSGLYQITGTDLQQAQIDISTIDPQKLRLFTGTGVSLPEDKAWNEIPEWLHEVAIAREGAEDGRFDPQDRVLFHGLGPDGWYAEYGLPDARHERYRTDEFSNVNTYWLTWGDFTNPSLSWTETDAGSPGTVETSALMREHFEKGLFFDPRPRDLGNGPPYPDTLFAWEKWHWIELVAAPGDSRTPINVSIPQPDPSSTARILFRMWGGNWAGVRPDHNLRVDLEGQTIAEGTWDDLSPKELIADAVPLSSGSLHFNFVAPYQTGQTWQDRSYLNWIEIDYRRTLAAQGDSAEFWVEPGQTPRTFAVSGLTRNQGIFVLDVTDPVQTVRINPVFTQDGTTWRAVWTVTPDTSLTRHLVVYGNAIEPAMARDAKPAGGYLRQQTAQVDYILIAHEDLMVAAERLKSWREAHGPEGAGLRVALVDVQDVYDEFSSGRSDPTAIRNFLAYAFQNWNGGDPGRSPSYALFLGDASYDFRNRVQLAATTGVPTYEGNFDKVLFRQPYSPQFGSDDWFVLIDPLHSPNLFMATGRLPAVDPASAGAMVDKVIAYESNQGTDGWRQRFTLVADDICQGLNADGLGFTHMAQTEQLSAGAIPDEMYRDKVYLYEFGTECIYDRKPAAAAALRQSIDRGTLVINFTGHGSESQLADERVLETSGVASMSNADRLFFFLTASCAVGKFDFGGEGLGEALIRQPGGGAIGVFSATAVAFSPSNAALNQEFFKAVWPGKNILTRRSLGKVGVLAKEALGPPSLLNSRRYPLLGDPATVLTVGRLRFDLQLSGLTLDGGVSVAHADSMFRGGEVRLTGTAVDSLGNAQDWNGEVSFQVYDSQIARAPVGLAEPYYLTGAPIFRGTAQVVNGTFETRFVAPTSLRTGTRGPAEAYAYGTDPGGPGVIGVLPRLTVPEIAPQGSEDRDGPVLRVSTTARLDALPANAVFHAILDDSSGINITQLIPSSSVLVRIEEGTRVVALEDIASLVVFPQGFQHGEADFTLPAGLTAGRTYNMILEASDNRDHRSALTVAFTLEGGSAAGLALASVYNVPNPAKDETTFFVEISQAAEIRIDVFSTSGRIVRRLRPGVLQPERAASGISWNLRDEDGDRLGNGVYFYKVSVSDGSGVRVSRIERLAVLR